MATSAANTVQDGAISSGIPCANCGKPASLKNQCPVCKTKNIPGGLFCTPECFKSNYKTHKLVHDPAPPSTYTFPPNTKEGFNGMFRYTGPLRAVYPIEPVPKREVPEDLIPYPDYAKNAKGESFLERIHYRMDRKGKELTPKEISAMKKVCEIGRQILDIAASKIAVGVTTLEIDRVVHEECMKRKAYPSPLGYHKFPRSVCTSVNEVICHGIPDARPLEEGDIINLDISVYHQGFHADLNETYPVGQISAADAKLIAVTRKCLDESIRICKPGVAFREIGEIIERIAKENNLTVNHTYGGHGVNQLFHCMPNISHYAGNKNVGTMKVGQTFTIEPMICQGNFKELHWPDNWTAVTSDGKKSAQFEETLLITPTGVEVLTAKAGWSLPPVESETLAAPAAS